MLYAQSFFSIYFIYLTKLLIKIYIEFSLVYSANMQVASILFFTAFAVTYSLKHLRLGRISGPLNNGHWKPIFIESSWPGYDDRWMRRLEPLSWPAGSVISLAGGQSKPERGKVEFEW